MAIFQPGLQERLDEIQEEFLVRWGLAPPWATKDGWFRNSIIANELSRRGLMELSVSKTWDGVDAYIIYEMCVEPAELKTNQNPTRTGRRPTKIDFHKGSIKHHEEVAAMKVIVGIFETFRIGEVELERLSEVWLIDTDSVWHAEVRKKIERMKTTGKKSSSLSLSYSRLPRIARRLI